MEQLSQLAQLVRYFILISTSAAGSGHPTSALSAADLLVTLFFGGFLRYDLENPDNPHNDRVIFSKGHASPLLYALYAAAGKLTEDELKTLRQLSSPLEGHPTMQFPYTEAATGSLGQGLSMGVGMALNAKYLDKSDYKTFVLLGDSETAEGQVWEAMQLAAYYKLNNLIGIIDVNRLGQRGETMSGYDVHAYAYKARAFGWQTVVIDGHNFEEIADAYQVALQSDDRPVMIIAKTIKGKGVSLWEDKNGWHSKTLNPEQLATALLELGPIEKIIGTIKKPPQTASVNQSAQKNLTSLNISFDSELVATKKAVGLAVQAAGHLVPELVVMDAEMSNSTHMDLFKETFPERFFEMFIAEQNMVSTAVGLARRGKLPLVSTFAAFFTRAFDQLRMAQYSQVTMVVCGTYAGVSMGMDGSSQMGLEDIAMMRSILHSTVLYPADAWSAVRLLELALRNTGITYVRTTREPTPQLYPADEQFSIGGSKTLRSSDRDQTTIVAAGITVHEALKAYELLKKENIVVRVIDLYSVKPLDENTLQKAARETHTLITVEDHYPAGGIGEAVTMAVSNDHVDIYSLAVTKMPHSGKPAELLAYEEIDATAIVRTVKKGIQKQ